MLAHRLESTSRVFRHGIGGRRSWYQARGGILYIMFELGQCAEKMSLRLPGKGGNRNPIQRWCRGEETSTRLPLDMTPTKHQIWQ